ncbi:DET1 homolog [Ornithodoros turicata]|uniref:Putative negative regulator of histones n=1 Tax=Ornithodoros turicata TaxID=34597 RepID=A0A2R5LD99_9ACAR
MPTPEKLFVVNRHRCSQDGSTSWKPFSINASQHRSRNSSAPPEDDYRTSRIPVQNIVLRLMHRETYAARQNVSPFHVSRRLHQNICPNFTVVNVEKPPCFLRKFSPDGRHFVAFSSDQTSIEIYQYCGPSAAAHLIRNLPGDQHTVCNAAHVRSVIFGEFLRLKHIVNVAGNGGEQLNRECSLFADDGKHVIVGSAMYVPDDPHPLFWDMHRNNESVSPNPRSPLEDYTLHLVDMTTGMLRDKRTFKTDKIFLSHNQGLYLYRDTLAVLSVQHQTVHIFKVTREGTFVNVRTVGRFCYEDDELLVSSAMLGSSQPYREPTINSLKHRLLVYLYRRAEGDPTAQRRFYQHFDQLCDLRLWKMQLLDENHLLLKYASEDVVLFRLSDPNSQPSFFVVYNIQSTQVLAVYENTSEELLALFEDFSDLLRNAALHSELTCSPSNNVHARLVQQRFKQTIVNARYGGQTEAVKRLLAQLPISSQSYSNSPYLDLSLFSYDDKWVSVLERPKACGDYPIRFYARDSGLLRFKIYAGVQGRNPPPAARRLVAFTFHPYDPFAISVQRTNAEYVVNFHLYKSGS